MYFIAELNNIQKVDIKYTIMPHARGGIRIVLRWQAVHAKIASKRVIYNQKRILIYLI